MNGKMSRREMISSLAKVCAGIAVIPGILLTTGCGPALILRAGVPRLSGVMWGAVRTRAALGTGSRIARFTRRGATRLTVKALVDADDWYVEPKATPSEMRRLEEEHARLILKDDTGAEFNTPYGIYEDVGIIQSCYENEPRYLFEQPDFDSERITELNIGQEVGVFSLKFTSEGWYQVQTTNREKGWIHGNCLEALPLAKYY